MSNPIAKQKGLALIFMAVAIFVVVVAAAFGVDLAYVYVQKNRLQNAADAAAVAGANTIYRSIEFRYSQFPSGPYPNPPTSLYFPNVDGNLTWVDIARNRVKESLTANASRNTLRTDADISVNWYNAITGNTNDLKVPAVRVNLFAPTSLFFAKVIGLDLIILKAQATAVATFPQSAGSGLPLAVANCAVNLGWDFDKREPVLTGTPPTARTFQFGTDSPGSDSTKCPTGASGSWTDFTNSSPSANSAGVFIPTSAIPKPPSITLVNGALMAVTNGAMTTNFQKINDCYPSTSFSCQYSVMPILNSGATDGLSSTSYSVKGFTCVKISGVTDTGSAKYVSGQFSTGCRIPSSGSGTNEFSGVIASATLVE